MAITRAQVSGLEALAAWLTTNCADLLGSATYSDDVMTLTDKYGNTILTAKQNSSGYVYAYRTADSYISASMSTAAFSGTTDIIACDNGIIIDANYTQNTSRKMGILITKTNNDKLAVIFSYGGTTSTTANFLYTSLQHVAWGDSTTMSTTTTFTPESAQQTCMTPFITNADVGDVSYTPNARYLTAHSSYASGIGKMLLGTDTWITNGYWAIKDGGAT